MGGHGVSEIVKKINDFYFLLTMWTGWGVRLIVTNQRTDICYSPALCPIY